MNEKKKNQVVLEDTVMIETIRVNGDSIITFDIEYTDNNSEVIKTIDKRWYIKTMDGQEERYYVVQNIYEHTFGDSMYISVDTLFEPHDILKREMVYKQYSGSMTRDKWFQWLFEGSAIRLEIGASSQYALDIESFGMDSRLSLFFDLLDKFQLEYYFTGNRYDRIRIVDKIGEDKSDYISHGVNMIEMTRSRQMSGFGTYGEIFGAYKNEEKPELGRYHETYTSPLAEHYGKVAVKPIIDERFKIKDNMIKAIKDVVDNSIIVSLEVSFDELTFERDGGWVGSGDSIMIIDERINMFGKIRVVQIDTRRNHLGEILSIDYTLGDYEEHYKSQTESINYPKRVDDRFKEVISDSGKLKEEIDVAVDMAGNAGKIYRQKIRPMGDGLKQGDLWYQPVYNSQLQREDIKMYQYIKEGNIGKWQEVTDIQLGDANNLTRGEINAKVINLINLNASEIVTGIIRGQNIRIDLDRGDVEFQKGKIFKSDGSFEIDVTNGTVQSKSSDGKSYFNIRRGEITLGDPRNPYSGDLGRIGYMFPWFNSGGGLTINGMSNYGITTDGAGIGRTGSYISGTKSSSSFPKGHTQIYAGSGISQTVDVYGSISSALGVYNGINIFRANNGAGGIIDISGVNNNSRSNIEIFANSKSGGTRGDVWIAGNQIRATGDFSVTGKKNAIHVTRDGVRETPAYETATAYIGDIGEVVTSPSGIATVEVQDIFYDIANFDEQYQVFLTPYDFCQFKVSVRDAKHFVIETDKGNCRVGYEIKAKRRGYENEWFNKSHMNNEDIKSSFTELDMGDVEGE